MSISAYRKLVPRWAQLISYAPAPLWPAVLYIPASFLFVAKLRSAVGRAELQTIREACVTSPANTLLTFFHSCMNGLRYDLEFASLERKTIGELQRWADAHTAVECGEILANQEKTGKPAILLLASFSLHYFGLLAIKKILSPSAAVTIVQPAEALVPLSAIRFYDKLQQAIGISVDTITADSPRSMFSIGKALKQSRLVALRVDSLPTMTANFTLSRLLGNPSMFPSSILTLAKTFNADLIPFYVHRRGNCYVTSFGTPVTISSCTSDERFIEAAAELDLQFGNVIRAMPGQYSGWYAIYEKWRMAREVRALDYDAEASASGY
jgi:hypothetical protein